MGGGGYSGLLVTGGEKPSFGFEIGDLGLSWIANFLVALFWVERFWPDFF